MTPTCKPGIGHTMRLGATTGMSLSRTAPGLPTHLIPISVTNAHHTPIHLIKTPTTGICRIRTPFVMLCHTQIRYVRAHLHWYNINLLINKTPPDIARTPTNKGSSYRHRLLVRHRHLTMPCARRSCPHPRSRTDLNHKASATPSSAKLPTDRPTLRSSSHLRLPCVPVPCRDILPRLPLAAGRHLNCPRPRRPQPAIRGDAHGWSFRLSADILLVSTYDMTEQSRNTIFHKERCIAIATIVVA